MPCSGARSIPAVPGAGEVGARQAELQSKGGGLRYNARSTPVVRSVDRQAEPLGGGLCVAS